MASGVISFRRWTLTIHAWNNLVITSTNALAQSYRVRAEIVDVGDGQKAD